MPTEANDEEKILEMHNRRTDGTAAGTVPTDDKLAHAGPQHLLNRWIQLPNEIKMGSLALLAVAALLGRFMLTSTRKNADIFYTGEISAVQVFGFIVFFTAILWYAVFELAAQLFVSTNATEWKRSILSEESEAQLCGAAEFSFYMLLFFFCDRTTYLPREKKHFDSDTFWALWIILVIVALGSLRKANPPKPRAPPPPPVATSESEVAVLPPPTPTEVPQVFHVAHLQRDQTEEWKGWMQIMFLWYHYFDAKPIYNVIRLYIAAYVWMTGFGNFSYYYIRKDFSLPRFLQMQWRLNFMVVWVCVILANEYMLYYICMLHTTFTLFIYAGLGLFSQFNTTAGGVSIKFAVLGAICFIMWDTPSWVFDLMWKPLQFLVQYHDPYKADRPIMSEWRFRSFLDHYIWIVGMWCAFNHPRFDAWLVKLDSLPTAQCNAIKGAVVAACLGLGYWYVDAIFLLPKADYNALHPYTSFIPILLFIVLRNIFTRARMYHMHLFEFLGKTTLETYIAQFHIWMATTGLNGSPKRLLRIMPSGFPLVNFIVVSGIFMFVSYRLFQVTVTVKNAVFPAKATNELLKNNLVIVLMGNVAIYVIALLLSSF